MYIVLGIWGCRLLRGQMLLGTPVAVTLWRLSHNLSGVEFVEVCRYTRDHIYTLSDEQTRNFFDECSLRAKLMASLSKFDA